jgi:putative FmdB family regulatory protein
MPTYEYRCLDCKRLYEKREGYDAPALQKCEACGGKARRVIQATPIVFKGSGFYVTDSRKASASESEGGSDGKAEPATGDKPAAEKPKADKPATADTPAKASGKDSATADKPAAAS